MALMRRLMTKSTAINVAAADQAVSPPSNGLYITTTGTLVVRFAEDSADVTLTNLQAGFFYPFAVKKIIKLGTTAAGFIIR